MKVKISNQKLLIASLGAVLLVAMTVIGYGVAVRPRAEVAETLHDFGAVSEDQKLTYTFAIRNNGWRPLEIKKVKADCACTATDYDKVIRPGGQGTMTLSIKPFSTHGNFAKRTTVTLNDPDQPEVVFTLKGTSRALVESKPSQVIRFRGKPGEELRGQVSLSANFPGSWEITSYKTSIPQFVDVALQAAEPGRTYVVEVRQKRQEPGKYQGIIELFTSLPQRPRLVLRVMGEVLPR